MKDMLMKVKRMDHLLLKQLIVQVNYDLKDLLQINLFSLNAFGERETFLNGSALSITEQRHFYASSLARSILDNPSVDYPLTGRQYAAANLLYYWGNILRPTESQPNHKNLLHTSIKNYIAHLEINEAKLFNSLLIDMQEQNKSLTKLPKKTEQKIEILRIIRDELGLDPVNLPPRTQGIAWVKSDVKNFLDLPSELFTNSSFLKAWEELRQSGEIQEGT